MKITKQELIDFRVGDEGLGQFIKQTNNTDEPIDVASLVVGLNNYDDLIWLACEKLPPARTIRLACDCALINIKLIMQHADKYDLIVDFLKNPDKFSMSDMIHVRSAIDYAAANAGIDCATDYALNAAKYAAYYYSASAVKYASAISRDAVNKLLIDMFNEVD